MGKTRSGQGYRVLITGAILQLFLGIIYVWSVFVVPVSEHFAWPVDSAKLTSSFMLSCFVLGILAGGRLQVKIGTDKVVLIGGLLMAAGMALSALLPVGTPWLLYLTYGVVGGLGVGMGYNAIITCAQRWFPTRRGFATGISVSAFGFSTVIFAPLVETLVEAIGLANTFLALAGAFLAVTVGLFRFSVLPPVAAVQASGGAQERRQYATGEILKTRAFYYITASLMLGTAAYFILNPSFKTMAAERGLGAFAGTAIVMLAGIANAVGRLVMPLLSDKIGRELAALFILAITALCSCALSAVGGAGFMVAVALIAFCYGGYSGIYPLLTGDAFGLKNLGANYGAVMVGFALSALFFPMAIGLIPGVAARFFVLAALAALGAVLVVLLRGSNRKRAA